jgi:hypothetical protein
VSRGLVHIRATLNRVGRGAKERPFGRFLQNRRKIGTEAKGDEKLSENVHRADQHVNRNVEQCWAACVRKPGVRGFAKPSR